MFFPEGRTIQPNPNARQSSLLRVVRGGNAQLVSIYEGKAGSYQTAEEMARLVRETATHDQALEKHAAQILIASRLDSHAAPDEIVDAIFRYVQKVAYISDTSGQGKFDAVASARDTLEKGYGDCDDLSVLLASLLALVGLRPAFVLAKMNEGSKGFDHVYVEVAIRKNGKQERLALDPTTRKFGIGWESPRVLEKIRYPIFGGNATHLSGVPVGLITTGAQIGLSLIPGVGPILSSLISPIAAMFHGKSPQAIAAGKSFDNLDKSLAAFLLELNKKADAGTLTAEDYSAAQNGVEALAQTAAQQMQADNTGYVQRQWASEQPRYAQWLQDLGAKVVRVANNSAASGSGTQGTGNDVAGALGSVSNSLPVLLAIGLGFFLLMRR